MTYTFTSVNIVFILANSADTDDMQHYAASFHLGLHCLANLSLRGFQNTSKTSAYFLRFDIKLKKPRSEFDLVTVLVSKQSFFQHRVWPV